MTDPAQAYAAKRDALAARLREGAGSVGLAKETSNLFRDRSAAAERKLDVRGFSSVLRVDREAGVVETEGMASYEAITDACLAQGVMPAVVPQLKTITLGGAVAGVGIEATSHRHGLVHETVQELDVLCGDGRIYRCTPDNEHSDLYFGFANSYGTLGYALRVTARTIPVKPYVRVEHLPFPHANAFFTQVERHCRDDDADFLDGTLFSPERLFLSLGRFVDDAPRTSDYTYEKIYYRSIPEKREDWLTARDYIWRWDTDWFWCSKNVGAQNPLIRRLYGRRRLGSHTYTKIMRWNSRVGVTSAFERFLGLRSESVIQDVDIPIRHAPEFLEFYAREIGIWPVWICPVGPQRHAARYPLYPMRGEWYINFGFWDVIRTRKGHERGHFNRKIERKVAELDGIKSLYSDSFFSEDEFWRTYGGEAYRALKAKYDPEGVFPNLYAKCVLRA
jgi:FAD/FMN-containing dehydrogenase